jgi:hypothetical protein
VTRLNLCFKARNLILTAALITGLGLVTQAAARERPLLVDLNTGTVTPLGTLDGNNTFAYDINEAGQVVGFPVLLLTRSVWGYAVKVFASSKLVPVASTCLLSKFFKSVYRE